MAQDLFSPLTLGGGKIVLNHRIVLAPLTRNRASEPELAPKDIVCEYYSQRATKGGLLISEAINITPESLAYPSAPGIWSREQVLKWKSVTDAGTHLTLELLVYYYSCHAFFICLLFSCLMLFVRY